MMNIFNLFKPKPILSKNALDFEIASFRWLLKFFPINMGDSEEVAKETFEYVKNYAGMSKWSCILEEQEADIDPFVSNNVMVKNLDNNPLGTFVQDHNYRAIITYNPSIVDKPMNLIATFAHELSHYRIRDTGATPPGGWENEEQLTDITATFLGFGVFMANSTFNTSTNADWWQANYSGYLSETERIYALGIFMELKEIPFKEVSESLKPHLRKLQKKVIKEIRRDKILERIFQKKSQKERLRVEASKYDKWRR